MIFFPVQMLLKETIFIVLSLITVEKADLADLSLAPQKKKTLILCNKRKRSSFNKLWHLENVTLCD